MDNFYLKKVFPEAEKIFEFEHKEFNSIKDNCIFVFDTNILFVPFLISKQGLKDYKKIFKSLKTKKKLFIPSRVAREFAKNRGENLKSIFRKLHEARDRTNKGGFDLSSLPILEEDDSYKRVKEIEKQVSLLKEEYRIKIDELADHIKSWNWNDPVSTFYRELWDKDMIVEVKQDEQELIKDLEFRQKHEIAPGFKDSKKIDDGIGDLIIWRTVLELAKDKQKNIVFVTNEEKNDWFYSEFNTILYPKFELFDEFRRFTGGHSISIINFEKFLIAQNASEETIKEVKELRAASGFYIIDKEGFVFELEKSLKIAKDKNGFVSSRFFIETVLAEKFFDIGSSWEMCNRLTEENVIEQYQYEDPNGLYPPLRAIRLKLKSLVNNDEPEPKE
ncbi:MAG: PIN domain-containing protein [Reichenbachiella sp.]|uniref:PIN domain-containing protein n=1 Tax=Reichenbachiella sp. TaxID=2184521 RepID=UPI0032653DBF